MHVCEGVCRGGCVSVCTPYDCDCWLFHVGVSMCVCLSYQCSWWRQLVGPRPPFHPTDPTENDGEREGKRELRSADIWRGREHGRGEGCMTTKTPNGRTHQSTLVKCRYFGRWQTCSVSSTVPQYSAGSGELIKHFSIFPLVAINLPNSHKLTFYNPDR